MEKAFTSQPGIRSALVLGNGKDRPALLAEASEQCTEVEQTPRAWKQVEDVLWPMLSELNLEYPPHSRVERYMIIVLGPGKSLPMNSKGYVPRKLTTQRYEALLNQLYIDDGAQE